MRVIKHPILDELDTSARVTIYYNGQPVEALEGEPIGLMRWSLFWDSIPFCNLLYVKDGFQRMGFGRRLTAHWEMDMRARGYDLVMTSTQVDETAQHFYRKLGYRDAGGFAVDIPGYAQPLELILIKKVG